MCLKPGGKFKATSPLMRHAAGLLNSEVPPPYIGNTAGALLFMVLFSDTAESRRLVRSNLPFLFTSLTASGLQPPSVFPRQGFALEVAGYAGAEQFARTGIGVR